MKRTLLVSLAALIFAPVFSQNGNFRSIASGPWDNASTWERDADSNGTFEDSPADMAPTVADGTITIRGGHVVRIFSNISIDQITVENGGRLAINTTNVVVANGDGIDLLNFGTVSTGNSSQLTFSAFAEFEHRKNGGSLPLATWQANSICTISGVTTGPPTNLAQTAPGFYTFNWNCQNQSTTVYLDGNLINIQGDLNVVNTNNFILNFSGSTAPSPINIGGDLNVTGNSRIHVTNSAVATVNIGGSLNFQPASASSSVLVTHSGSATVNIGETLNINSAVGILDLSGGSGTGMINLSGDFVLLNGTLTETGTSIGEVNFVGGTVQTFTNAATISNQIDYTIAEGSTLYVSNESAIKGRTLNVNGTLGVESLNSTGAIVLGTTLGNVRTNNRNYGETARIVYRGSAAQFVGNGHPATIGVDIEIDNPNGVTFNTTTQGNNGSATLWIGGDIVLTSGNLNLVSTTTSRSLRLEGGITAGGNFITITGINTDLLMHGSGPAINFPLPDGEHTIRALTVNRPGTVAFNRSLTVRGSVNLLSGTLDFNNSANLNGSVSLSAGTTLSFRGRSITLSGAFSSAGGFMDADEFSTLSLRGNAQTDALSYFSPTGNTLNTLVIDKPNSGIMATVTAPLTVAGTLQLTDGELNISGGSLSLADGATLSMSSISSISGTSPSGGPWHLVYTLGSLTTGLEIPASGIIESMAINSTGGSSILLNRDITINSTLTISENVDFNASANSITTGSVINSGSFTGPGVAVTSGLVVMNDFQNNGTYGSNGMLTISGDLINNGSFEAGTVVFAGISDILDANPITFNHVIIEGTLNGPATLAIEGDFTNNGIFNANGGEVNFNGAALQTLSGSAVTIFNNLNINNVVSPVSVTVVGIHSLRGTLTLASGAQFDADGDTGNAEFIILSDENGDGRIATLPVSSTVMGNVTVQRFLEASGPDYRFISSPVTAAPVSQLQDDFSVTGVFSGSDDINEGPSLRYYHEAFKGPFDEGYAATPVTNGSNTETLLPGRGYSAYMWDGSADVVMDVRATINRGLVNFTNVRHTVSNPVEPGADGWNLVGNPYPSAIQWNNGTGWTRSENIDPTVWVWDVLQGVWRSYNYESPAGATLTDGVIASGQAFWVYVHTAGTAQMSINEDAKYAGSGTYYRARTEKINELMISLSGNGSIDYASVQLTKNGTKTFDFGLDAYKPVFGIETLSLSILDEQYKKLSPYAIGYGDIKEMEFQLWIAAKAVGDYQLSFSNAGNSEFDGFFLYDKLKQTYSPLNENYHFSVTNDVSSKGDRFLITRNKQAVVANAGEKGIRYYPNPVESVLSVEISGNEPAETYLLNAMGEIVHHVDYVDVKGVRSAEINMSALPAGLYVLRVIKSNDIAETYKIVKK